MGDSAGSELEHRVAPHVRRLRSRALRDRLAESLLFIPGLMLAASVALAMVLGHIDAHHVGLLSEWVTFTPDVAVTLLGIIAGAMITTAGVVFSLLVVSLQLASGQFSPRVLRGFWRDRPGQVLVGLLLSTFAFCVLALARVDTSATVAPTLTVGCALLLTLASVLAIVVYLDRISRQQYVGRIMERVARETTSLIAELPYGPRIGVKVGEPVEPPDVAALGPGLAVPAVHDGWVQQLSRRALVAAAPPGSVVRLDTRVGAYLVAGTPMVTIWPAPADPATSARLVCDAVIVGVARTMQQDIDFGLRQLSDIGLRALSAAVNDPTTAIEVILRMASVLRPLMLAETPARAVRDGQGRTLLTPHELGHADYVEHAFHQLRTYAAPHPSVVVPLVRSMRMLRTACTDPARGPLTPDRAATVAALDQQLALTVAAVRRAGPLPEELAAIEAIAAG
ncbi:DUF2254 domain-containing protein [Catellatospora sp. KI3]|uniref:DUF2254 domain-containing protein n=1 Tax=Catellatospora sp. KI3 TaxID=3041620 RepID=UPI0024831387|nr:DUF2254 domain-containing protein [Catellatospora sp. KI3]MDI1459874.1 DUF2254 domain-containing protein [Catellatospora sp. KI3]